MKMIVKSRFFIFLALLIGGCDKQIYINGIESSSWPNVENPYYSISISYNSELYLINHINGQTENIPVYTTKFSRIITNRIKFSNDGRFLLIPVFIDNLFDENNQYYLNIWDIKNHVFLKKVSIKKDLIFF